MALPETLEAELVAASEDHALTQVAVVVEDIVQVAGDTLPISQSSPAKVADALEAADQVPGA